MSGLKNISASIFIVLCIAQGAFAAADCSMWTGVWDILYDNGTISVWTIDKYDNDPDSEVLLCTAVGTEQFPSGETLPIYIMYLKFTKSYYFAYSAEKPSRETPSFDLICDNNTLISEEARMRGVKRAGTGVQDNSTETLCIAEQLAGRNSYTVKVMRQFRDRILMRSAAGNALAQFYYTHSDHIAEMLKEHPGARYMAKKLIALLVPALEKATAPAE